jgi:tripartite-type tricarboxylate transporter receptor subunit TctC
MRKLAAILIIVVVSAVARVATADNVGEFYHGKTINIVVGHQSGTGYDFFARVLARHLAQHIPGHPNIVTQNMPGAGGTRAANWLYNIAAKDGTVVSIFAPETALKSIFGDAAAHYDSTKFTWIGNMDESIATCVVSARSGIKLLDDLLTRQAIFGATGKAAPTSKFAYALINFLGAKLKIVQGYKGSAALKIALSRGEIQGACGMSYSTLKTRWKAEIASGQVKAIIQFGLKKSPDLSGVAHIYDYAKSNEQRAIFDVAFGPHALGRPLIAPPGIPADRTRALRAAFMKTMQDKALLGEMKKSGLSIAPSSGEEVAALVARFASFPKSIIAKAAAGLHEKP